jgi:hypothetical protein
MRSRFVVPALFVGLFLGSAARADDAKAAHPDDAKGGYYPLEMGTRWSYTLTTPNGKKDLTAEDERTEKLGNDTCTVVITKDSDGTQIGAEDIVERPDGVYRAGYGGTQVNPPFLILKLPAEKGLSWKNSSTALGAQITASFTIDDASEDVTVPAGSFKCIVTSTDDLSGNGQRIGSLKTYYAKGVGIVKQVSTLNGTPITLELTKFEAPADYFPLKLGTRLTYSVTASEKKVTVEAARTEKQGDETCTVFITKDSSGSQLGVEGFARRSDGIYRTSFAGSPVTPPFLLLQLPAKKGASWKAECTSKAGNLSATFTIEETDKEVTVPAGTFKCVVVSTDDLTRDGQKMSARSYYANGVGLVKKTQTLASGSTITLELLKVEETGDLK